MTLYDWTDFDTKVFEKIWEIMRQTGKKQVPQRELLSYIQTEIGCSYTRALERLSYLVKKEPKLYYKRDKRPWRDLKIRVWLCYSGEIPKLEDSNLFEEPRREEKDETIVSRRYAQKPIPLKTPPFRKRT